MSKQLKLNRLSKRLDKAFLKINRGVNKVQKPSIETEGLTKNDLKLMIELAEFKEFLDEVEQSTEGKKSL